MPIVILEEQRRFRELGRIRLGEREPVLIKSGANEGQQVHKEGKPVFRPKRLPDFRLTSKWRHLLDEAQKTYGGEVRPWSPSEGRDEFELLTGSDTLDVLVPPGEVLSQWMEEWSGGGCQRRCDGVRMIVAQGRSADRGCLCSPDGTVAVQDRKCQPYTRLLLMVPDLPDLGVWRVESHGVNAALELGKNADFLSAATARGAIIPATLRIENREVRKPGEPTKRFNVPILGFRFGLGETLSALGFGDPGSLAMIAGTGPIEKRPELSAGGAPELPNGEPEDARQPPAKTPPGPGPVEEASLPPATGGAATDGKETGTDLTDRTGADDIEDAVIVIPEEPAPFVPPAHDPEAEHGDQGPGLTPAQFIAIRAREAGVDEDTRHAVIGIITGGRTRTGKEVKVGEETTRVLKLFDAIKAGGVTVSSSGEGDARVWTFADENGKVRILNADNTITNPALGEHGDDHGNLKPPAAR